MLNFSKLWLRSIRVSFILLIIPWHFVEAKTVNIAKLQALSCPNTLENLTVNLLRDLPSYANRVVQRTQKLNRQAGRQSYMLTAGRANFEPLNLPRLQYNPKESSSPEQIFFTVLERQYSFDRQIELQTYHWLFLTQTSNGWYMVTLFSRFGNATDNPPTPPQETSDGIIGQAIQTWLRDCRAKKRP